MQKSPVAYLISTLVMSTTLGTIVSALLVVIWQGFLSPQFQKATTLRSAQASVSSTLPHTEPNTFRLRGKG